MHSKKVVEGDTLLSFQPPTSSESYSYYSGRPKIASINASSRVASRNRRDLNAARFINLMLPISFKPLLKYLRRWSLVSFGKLLERKRVGHTHNIGIDGLQDQHLARLKVMNQAAGRHTSGDATICETDDVGNLHGRTLIDGQFDARLQE